MLCCTHCSHCTLEQTELDKIYQLNYFTGVMGRLLSVSISDISTSPAVQCGLWRLGLDNKMSWCWVLLGAWQGWICQVKYLQLISSHFLDFTIWALLAVMTSRYSCELCVAHHVITQVQIQCRQISRHHKPVLVCCLYGCGSVAAGMSCNHIKARGQVWALTGR